MLSRLPLRCAHSFSEKRRSEPSLFLYKWFNKGYGIVIKGYTNQIGKLLRHPIVAIGIYFVICAIAFWGFIKLPSSYIPQEDMGYFMTSIQLPTGASLDRTDKIVTELSDKIKNIEEVKDIISISGQSMMGGGSGGNMGSLLLCSNRGMNDAGNHTTLMP